MKLPTILYIGPYSPGTTSLARKIGLEKLGFEVSGVNFNDDFAGYGRLLEHLQKKILIGPALSSFNRRILQTIKNPSTRPDVLWVDKGIYVFADVIKQAHELGIFILHHNTDDLLGKHHNYRHYLKAFHYYDLHLTTNTFNVDEMRSMNAKRVELTELGYDSELCYPLHLTEEQKKQYEADVIFIGHWEQFTEEYLSHLIDNGINVKIWGWGWRKAKNRQKLIGHAAFGQVPVGDYARAIQSAKIPMCFLSKWNRNTSTARSFEIPAMRCFMLAERTDAHTKYYKEGVEAEFFDGKDEMLSKVRFYLDNPQEREKIAERGYLRATSSGYSFAERVKKEAQYLIDEYCHFKKLPIAKSLAA